MSDEFETIEALREANKELADLKFALDQSSIVATTDHRGIITYVNNKFCEISKYAAGELIGQDHRILNSGYHPKGYIRQLWRTIAQGRVWRGELRNRTKEGEIYWVDTTIVPFLNQDGKPYKYLSIRSDITEQKRVTERLRQRETMAQLGQMAAVIAHEVKNPLAGISGAIQVIRKRLAGTAETRILGEIQARVTSLNESLEALLYFARPRPPRPKRISLRELAQGAISLLMADTSYAGTPVEITGHDVELYGDRELLGAAVLNLLLNAVHAAGPHGSVGVDIEVRDGYAELSVTDDGPGFDVDSHLDAIFKPFFTTKVSGTGLGLAVVRQTMEAHGGTVGAQNNATGGARLTISLPLPPG